MKRISFWAGIFILSLVYACSQKQEVNPLAQTPGKQQNQQQNSLPVALMTTNTISGTANADFLTGTSANDQILAYASNDQVYANGGNDLVYGGKGDDFIQGNSGADVLRGDRGNDKLYGGTGNDELHGGKDNDELYGEGNNDKLYGNKGNDMLYGGSGNDNYYYTLYDGTDVIDDASGTDVLYLQSISKSQVSVSNSGSDVVLSVPSGRITIKNGSVESVYANGQQVSIQSSSKSAQIAQYADDNWQTLLNEANGQITAGTACAAFVSATLRKFSYNIWATVTDGTSTEDSWGITLKYQLVKNGYKQSFNAAYLRKGDICFTIDKWFSDNNGGNYYPTHCYFFLEWVTPGRTDYAWVVDNQGRRHQRNITANGSYDKFQYFMYKD